MTVLLATNVLHGTLSLSTNGGFTYLPATNYFGADSFSYRAFDGDFYSGYATVTLTVVAPPAITNQPQSQAVVVSNNASFSVAATGTSPMHFQWFYQGAVVAGATNATLTVSNVQYPAAGSYSVVLTNIAGVATSSVASLVVAALPGVSILPATGLTAGAATLNAAVNPNGAGTLCIFQYGVTTNYGSLSSSTVLSAGTNATNVGTPVSGLNSGTTYHYRMVAANATGSTFGADATFSTVTIPPFQFTGTAMNGPSPGATNMQLTMTSAAGATFTVMSSSNLVNWTPAGTMTETSPGQYRFTDPQASTNPLCYYRILSQ